VTDPRPPRSRRAADRDRDRRATVGDTSRPAPAICPSDRALRTRSRPRRSRSASRSASRFAYRITRHL